MSNNNPIMRPNFLGPPSYTQNVKNNNRKRILKGHLPNPIQSYPASGNSVFAMGRRSFKKKAIDGGQNSNIYKISGGYDQNLHVLNKKSIAIGKQAYKVGLTNNDYLSYSSFNVNDVKNALRITRAGGCIAPAKKTALENKFQSGGTSLMVKSGNACIYPGSTLSSDPEVQNSDEFTDEINRIHTHIHHDINLG